jgi:hypothetical protein
VGDEIWSEFSASAEVVQYRQTILPSYGWDSVLEILTDLVINDRMLFGNEDGVAGHEQRLRTLARTTRLERIRLTEALTGLMALPDEPGLSRFRAVRLGSRPDTIYALLVMCRL